MRTAQLLATDIANAIRKPATGEHVDILGSNDFIADVLHLACGHRELLSDRIASNINDLSDRLAERLKL